MKTEPSGLPFCPSSGRPQPPSTAEVIAIIGRIRKVGIQPAIRVEVLKPASVPSRRARTPFQTAVAISAGVRASAWSMRHGARSVPCPMSTAKPTLIWSNGTILPARTRALASGTARTARAAATPTTCMIVSPWAPAARRLATYSSTGCASMASRVMRRPSLGARQVATATFRRTAAALAEGRPWRSRPSTPAPGRP